MAFVDDECDNPAANGYFDADIRKQEERHEVDGPETEDLLVLAYALLRVLRFLVRELTHFYQALCLRYTGDNSSSALGLKQHGRGVGVAAPRTATQGVRSCATGHSPSVLWNLNVKAWRSPLATASPM